MKLIKFTPQFEQNDLMLDPPKPVKNFTPEWYRNSEHYYISDDGSEQPGLKTCAPFLDAMLSGYVLVTPFPIYVGTNEDGSLRIQWNGPDEWAGFVMERPKKSGELMPRPAGHHPNHLVWSSKWGWKTPRGYSSLVTHPLNRHDLPFTTQSGIIDSDKFFANGNLPFFIKEGFVGTIPAGTPYCQIIPIKRSGWKSILDFGLNSTIIEQGRQIRKPGKSYKQIHWQRKKYS